MKIDYLKNHPTFVEEVNEHSFNEWSNLFPGSTKEQWLEELYKRLNDNSIPMTLIAFNDATLIGTASLFVSDMEDRPELSPWLAGVFVKPKFRESGMGENLIRAIDQEALRLGFSSYYLYTAQQETFYTKRGWTVFERRTYHGEEIVIMKKEL